MSADMAENLDRTVDFIGQPLVVSPDSDVLFRADRTEQKTIYHDKKK